MKNLKIFAATYAPFKTDLSLNLEVVGEYSNYLNQNKINGVFLNGSTGDFASLTIEERKNILEAWASEKKELSLINHVGDISLKNAMDLAEHSRGKADAIAAIAPFYFKPESVDQLVEYCQSIAQCTPETPFYFYHLPALTNVNLDMTIFLKKAIQKIPNFAGIKFTQNDLVSYQQTKAIAQDKDIFFGVDEAFLPSLAAGAKGWVGSTFNHLAPLYQTIIQEFDDGNFKKCQELQLLAINFIKTLASHGSFNGAGKSFMKTLGVDCGPSRFPHCTLQDQEIKQAVELFKSGELSDYFGKNVKI